MRGFQEVGRGKGAIFSLDIAFPGQTPGVSCCSIATQGCSLLPQGKSNLLSTSGVYQALCGDVTGIIFKPYKALEGK